MAGEGDGITRLLRELKERSGRSYDDLGRRALVGRSTLHRYCTGKALPPDAETVIRIARACDATDAEADAALAAWLAARPATDTTGPSEAPPPAGKAPDRPATGPPDSGPSPAAMPASTARRGGRRWTLVAAGAGLVAVLAAALLAGLGGMREAPSKTARGDGPPRLTGPAWQVHPKAVDPAFFGVTMNSDTGEMPTFRVGSVRLWDSGTKWSDIQPRHGAFDWHTLDRLVSGADDAGLESTFVFGATPAWAAPGAPRGVYPDGSRAAAPDHLADWDALVRKLVHRYHGRIAAYEVWNMANDRRYYSGSMRRLVEMTRRASRAIHSADPDALVVCPGMTELYRVGALRALDRFARLGGYRHCDVASVKLHQRRVTDPPESTLTMLRSVQKILHDRDIALPLWNTGVTYDIPFQSRLPTARAVSYATRFYLSGLYGRVYGLRRAYFYNWGSTRIPAVLQGVGGPPTKAARAVDRLQRWLAGARIAGCGQGRQIGLPPSVWQCEFRVAGHRALIRWTHTGMATTTIPSGVTTVHRLEGSVHRLDPGRKLTITGRPVLLDGRT